MSDDSLTLDDWIDSKPTVDEADIYHEARGNSLWTGTDTVKEQALQRSWDYLRGLDWLDGVFDDELPDDVKNAQIVAALEELKEPNILQPVITKDDYLESKNVAGVIIKTYRANAPTRKKILALDSLLRAYLRSSGNAAIEIMRG
jgi:hypothetical protein